MRVSYDRLWKKLIDEKMNKRDLMRRAKVSTNIIAKMGKEEPIALESVAKICAVFGGGGHVKAAGCTMTGKPEEIAEKISGKIKEQWDENAAFHG